MPEAVLIFPHQCFRKHPGRKHGRLHVFIEDSLFFGDPTYPIRFHQQKLVLHRSILKTLCAEYDQKGLETLYSEHEPGATVRKLISKLKKKNVSKIILCNPVDFILNKRIQETSRSEEIELEILRTPSFLNTEEWNQNYFSGRKSLRMASFYTEQRKRLGILIHENDEPEGGKWSFDEENRKSLPKGIQLPDEPISTHTDEDKEAIQYVEKKYGDHPGKAEDFWYPTTHRSASLWLSKFLKERFELFGDYEDAIAEEESVLYHSVLTPMLNTGLLTPKEVVDQALEYAKENKVPLNCTEGFIRQIIGWREFMRAMYEHCGVEARTKNFWKFDRKIPDSFYDGTTGIRPIDDAIQRTIEKSYCHHIERLMILGNFMLLCRFDPDEVYRWFMELFIDAYDWVMVPNVYSMSQFADGGLFTTKPYLSGSNYVRKMSNYQTGDWCETWDGLYWAFIEDHKDFFTSQPRLSMMVRTLERMSDEKRKTHRKNAMVFLDSL